MTTLQFCDDILSRRSIEILVDENELMEILNEVQLLTNDILRGGLDADIKKFLVRQLETIRQAIIDYKLNGSFSLRKAFENTVGGTLANIEKIKESENTEEVKSYKNLLRKFATLVKPTYSIAKFAYQEKAVILSLPAKLHELYEWFFSPPGSSPPPALPPST